MKKLFVSVRIFIIIIFFSSIYHSQNYKLAWSDEFTGRELNENIWTREIGGNGWGNEEIQYYTNRDTNAFVKDGILTIRALKENFGGRNYTSARLITKDNKFFKYRKVEARIKLPYGQGLWPAFWMLGQNIDAVPWPGCGEIDILEMIGGGEDRDDRVYGTVHWEQNGHAEYGGSTKLANGIFADDFHIFSIEWTPQFIKWFLDGKQYHVIDITPSGLSEFQNEFFIILNVAVGGLWPGYPDASTVFPQTMEVDYVRVYQDAAKFPEITLIQPEINVFPEFSNIKLTTEVEFDGDIEKVEFYQGQTQIGETYVEPYEMIWRNIYSGNYVLKAKAISTEGYSSESNISNIIVADGSAQAPYSGSAFSIPGQFEAEDFDLGGSGIAYIDNSVQNEGDSYRTTESVDIEICADEGGGYNVGWTEKGEWTSYFIDVENGGEYELAARVASENSGGSFIIQIDDQNLTPPIEVPNTGGWQEWTTVSSTVQLSEGLHVLKFVVDNGGFNINWFEIYLPNSQANIDLISPIGGENYEIGSIHEIRWDHLKVSNVSIGLSIDGGNNWSFIAKDINAKFGFYRWLVPDSPSNDCMIMVIDSKNSAIRAVTNQSFTIGNVNSVESSNSISNSYFLHQNYPNPFNPSTIISYRLPKAGFIQLRLYDQLGKEVKILVNEFKARGNHNYEFNGSELTSGIYFYTLKADGFIASKKLLLLK